MTSTANARTAGVTFLVYIAAGIASLVVFGRATSGPDVAARLAAIGQHVAAVRLVVVLALLQSLCALVLGVTLYAITRAQDAEVAMLAMICRVVEGITAIFVPRTLGLLWLATAAGPTAPDRAAAYPLTSFLFRMGAWNPGAIFFAVGSALFCWLFLRGRMIPVALAWLGVIASALLIVVLPLDLVGVSTGPVVWVLWMAMLVFEVTLAAWLIVKGVKMTEPGN